MNEAMVMQRIRNERSRQEAKWGQQNHDPLLWLAILGEEVGEANKAAIEGEGGKYCKELVEVAAVAVAAVESYYRNFQAGEPMIEPEVDKQLARKEETDA